MNPFNMEGGHRLGGGTGGGDYGRAPGSGFGDDGDNCQTNAMLGGGICCMVALGIVATFSLGTVPLLHYGIKYNSFTKSAATDAVYESGRHVIGPMNSFLIFPSSAQNIEFINDQNLPPSGERYDALETRTKEGFGLKLHVSLQYKLQKEHVGELYNKFNLNYEDVFTSVARDTLIKAASEYNAVQLWKEREAFAQQMQSMIDVEFQKIFAKCWNLQLTIIDLPDKYEQTLTKTQVQQQAMLVREQEQISAKIRAETSVIEAEYDKRVKVIMADGHANYTLATKEAEASARQRRITVESNVLAHIRDTLALSAGNLVTYQRYGALDDIQSATVLYGFSGAQQLLVRP